MKTCTKCGETKPLEMFSRKLKGYQSRCKTCCSADHKAWHAANKAKANEASKRRYRDNREAALAKQKEYYANNSEACKAYANNWRTDNKDKVKAEYLRNADAYRLRAITWKRNNPDKQRANEALRRSRVRHYLPWADKNAIAEVYRDAREMRALGIDCEVDHIIPLRGKTVSGLHVHNNLRVVLREDNRRKWANFDEDMHGQ